MRARQGKGRKVVQTVLKLNHMEGKQKLTDFPRKETNNNMSPHCLKPEILQMLTQYNQLSVALGVGNCSKKLSVSVKSREPPTHLSRRGICPGISLAPEPGRGAHRYSVVHVVPHLQETASFYFSAFFSLFCFLTNA